MSEYQIVEAADGRQALNILRRPNEIDLVLLDVMMPGLRGTEVLKELKKNDPELGIVILTGYSSKDIAIEALKGRADEYLEKPLNIDRAKEIIANLLETRELKENADNFSARGKSKGSGVFLNETGTRKFAWGTPQRSSGSTPNI